MNIIKCFIISWALFTSSLGFAQQEMLYTQYFFSQLVINPAYAGNDDGLSLTGLSRKQWFGIEGSPTTFSFIAHTSISNHNSNCRTYAGGSNRRSLRPVRNKQMGLGLVVFNDKIGVTNTFLTSLSYSYKIKFKPGTRLSFGLQTTVLNFGQLLDKLENPEYNDPTFQDNITALRFNVGTGIFFETDRFYIGGSVPELYKNILDSKNTLGEKQLRQYFLTGGYVFYLNKVFKFKPTFLVRYTDNIPWQSDISANFLYNDKLWVGVSYRHNNSLNFTSEIILSGNFRIGVAYDYAIGAINKATYGSAEIMINYVFQKSGKKIINPRYF
jgi:type IX secretion system PorP/SprF family membrane protein